MGAQLALIVSFIAIQALNKAIIPYFYEALKQKKLVIQQLHKWALFSFFANTYSCLNNVDYS